MSKKTLNATNLAALGPERLAALLIEVSTGSAQIKRRLRLELSHNLGPDALAHDVRKRLATIRRAKGYVGWRKRKSLITDLATQSQMITEKIAPDAPADAFELLWQFMDLAPAVLARVDDSRGEVRTVFTDALPDLATLAQRATLTPPDLARRIWEALYADADDIWTDIIALMTPALGETGLEALKQQVLRHADMAQPEAPHAALQFLRELRNQSGVAQSQTDRLIRRCLQDIATAQGDTDTYIAQFTPQALLQPTTAAQAAERLRAANRAEEALALLRAANPGDASHPAWNAAYAACLTDTGQHAEAQAHHHMCFMQTLDAEALRAYLKPLPDFEDVEAEDAAMAHALTFPDAAHALHFLILWPAPHHAAKLVEERIDALDGALTHILTPAAEVLRTRYPLAATLLWRRMVEAALAYARATSYAAAADMIMDCASVEADITDLKGHLDHSTYLQQLKNTYAQKKSFWARIR